MLRSALPVPKSYLRIRLLQQRERLSVDERKSRSLVAQRHLLLSDIFSAARTIALYRPIRGEVATAELFSAARLAGKTVCFPRLDGDHMVFVAIADEGSFVPGAFGVEEPWGTTIVTPDSIDLTVVPGVAFDRQGHRLGYGKGYYDRELSQRSRRGTLVGLCFDFQFVDRLPAESHDIPLDCLVTENGFFTPRVVSDAHGSP
ncbi:MAG: 5-formyltetrahydrofolate cyclo-ligase [Desulfuromonas sp.]|nr:MAG: 5-formyltetrahydrofolate cyclo-ligase [Desulfuromonas sp.]